LGWGGNEGNLKGRFQLGEEMTELPVRLRIAGLCFQLGDKLVHKLLLGDTGGSTFEPLLELLFQSIWTVTHPPHFFLGIVRLLFGFCFGHCFGLFSLHVGIPWIQEPRILVLFKIRKTEVRVFEFSGPPVVKFCLCEAPFGASFLCYRRLCWRCCICRGFSSFAHRISTTSLIPTVKSGRGARLNRGSKLVLTGATRLSHVGYLSHSGRLGVAAMVLDIAH
jgi:hypothetical protein